MGVGPRRQWLGAPEAMEGFLNEVAPGVVVGQEGAATLTLIRHVHVIMLVTNWATEAMGPALLERGMVETATVNGTAIEIVSESVSESVSVSAIEIETGIETGTETGTETRTETGTETGTGKGSESGIVSGIGIGVTKRLGRGAIVVVAGVDGGDGGDRLTKNAALTLYPTIMNFMKTH